MACVTEDTRQQAGKHENKHRWWADHGVEVERKKLDFGDYMSEGSNISIDTKRSIAEVAMDVGRDHKRFVREMERAADAGYRLVILIEVGGPYRELEDVCKWTAIPCQKCEHRRDGSCNPRASMRCQKFHSKPMQGPTVYRIMKTLEANHGCRFELCRPSISAQRICEILGVSYT